MNIRQDIEKAMFGRQRPAKILLPQAMYDQFVRESTQSGYTAFVWSVPVEVGDVNSITLVPAKKQIRLVK